MQRRTISCLVLGLAVAILLVFVPHVLLIVFAGLLTAVLLHGAGALLAGALRLPVPAGIGLFVLLLAAALAGFGYFAAGRIAGQFQDLANQLPGAIEALRGRIESYSWGPTLLQWAHEAGPFLPSGHGIASTAVFSTFGAVGNLVVILFIGAYVALDPEPYRRGLLSLVAPSFRPRADAVIGASATTLKHWLGAQLLAMALEGTATGVALWIIGIPLAATLGLITGFLAFLPNIGAVIAIVPALLLAVSGGFATMLWVLAVYVAVQVLDSYVIIPLVQQRSVALPPALIIATQLLFGVAFGLFGLVLATPFAALVLTLVRALYVEDYLEREPKAGSAAP
jgi:predicted PurR-regulated permease PerM